MGVKDNTRLGPLTIVPIFCLLNTIFVQMSVSKPGLAESYWPR